MNAIEFLVWAMTNPDATDADLKAKYESVYETDQHRLQRAVATYGKPDDSVSKLVGDPDYA